MHIQVRHVQILALTSDSGVYQEKATWQEQQQILKNNFKKAGFTQKEKIFIFIQSSWFVLNVSIKISFCGMWFDIFHHE